MVVLMKSTEIFWLLLMNVLVHDFQVGQYPPNSMETNLLKNMMMGVLIKQTMMLVLSFSTLVQTPISGENLIPHLATVISHLKGSFFTSSLK